MSEGVSIVGGGHAVFGKRKDAGLRDLAHEAVKDLFDTTNVSKSDIDATVIGVAGDGEAFGPQ